MSREDALSLEALEAIGGALGAGATAHPARDEVTVFTKNAIAINSDATGERASNARLGENTMRKLKIGILVCMSMILGIGTAPAEGTLTKVKGYVIDSSCAFVKDLKKPISSECAVACAKGGSPLVILTDSGIIYWPISGTMPAAGQNDRLMEFAGKRVVATGKVYSKGGSRAIVIENVEAAPTGK
jgi:hypothetical protein